MTLLRKVMCFGTFDLLHLGHINYFKQAKQNGDYLIVVIARDTTKQDQKKDTVFNEDERLELVKNIKIVDEAILGDKSDHFKVIRDKQPDVLALGYDHEIKEDTLRKKSLELGLSPEIKRMLPYQANKNKSSIVKEKFLHTL